MGRRRPDDTNYDVTNYLDSGLPGTSMPNKRLRSGLSGAK